MRAAGVLALVLAVLAGGCGGSHRDSIDLRTHAVHPPTLASAWNGFDEFAAVRVAAVTHDDYLFEFGVFDERLRVAFVRQLELASGELQQVHLELSYPLDLSTPLRGALGVEKCSRGDDCRWKCALGNDSASMLLPTPCRLDAATPVPAGLLDASTWSADGFAAWRTRVLGSRPFRFLRNRRALGYRVWRDSTD